MPRPTNKTELLAAAGTQWEKLWRLVDAMPPELREAAFSFGDDPKLKEAHWRRDANLRDVLVHLHEWHRLWLDWTAANLGGQTRPFLPEPFTWQTYGQMNVEFWQKHQDTPTEKARALLTDSHASVVALIETFANEALFTKRHFSWTGTTNLASYCVSATSSHYDWAIKKLRLHARTHQERS